MEELNRRQQAFLMALLQCGNVEQASKQAGIVQSTAYNYLNDPIFKRIYREHRNRVMQSALDSLSLRLAGAFEVLEKVMRDEDSPAGVRVQAAKVVIETALKGMEMDTLEDMNQRLSELERDMNE